MPVVSVRDIAIAPGGDLAIATHGRGFWILDDVEPLREFAAHGSTPSDLRLFTPRETPRTRDYSDEAEATPPEVVLGENPPNGAFIDYALPSDTQGAVTIEIRNEHRMLLRRFRSTDTPHVDAPGDVDYPAYWIDQPKIPASGPGMHRFVWDFRIARSDGPLAALGIYTVALLADGKTLTESLRIVRDPRIAASEADLIAQTQLAVAIDTMREHVRNKKLKASLGQLEAAVESADARPTHDQLLLWSDLKRKR